MRPVSTRALCATLATATAFTVLTGCRTAPQPLTPVDETINRHDEAAGPPLPAGAEIEPAGSVPPRTIDITAAEGSYKPDDAPVDKRVPEILRRGRLIVGVDQANNLLSYRDSETGELRGFEADIAREIARDIFGNPDRVEFRFVTSSEREEALDSGHVDLIIRSMTVTAERQAEVEFSIPYLVTNTRMLVPRGSGIDSVADLSGRTACAAFGSTSLERIRAFAPQAHILATRSWGDCLMALQLGQVAAVVTDDALLSGMRAQDPYTEIVGDSLSTEYYAVGVRRPDAIHDTRGLIRQVNVTMERIRRDGTWRNLFDTWLSPYLPVPTLPAPDYREEEKR